DATVTGVQTCALPICIRSGKISLVEKLDVLLPTLNLPLSLCYFLFVLDANLVFPMLFGRPQTLTLSLGALKFALPTWQLHPVLEIGRASCRERGWRAV